MANALQRPTASSSGREAGRQNYTLGAEELSMRGCYFLSCPPYSSEQPWLK